METVELLEKIGLNKKQASVYLALLELGTASVHPIASKAGIKRPTTYLILEELQQKGLVSIIPREKKVMYTAESPEKLLSDLNKKQELVKRFLPNLLALFNAKKEKPQVQLFEGLQGVKDVYEKIYESLEVWFFGTPQEILKIEPSSLKSFVKKVKTGGLKVKDLLSNTPEHREYIKWASSEKTYEIRCLPNGLTFFTDCALFGDSVAFFSFKPTLFSVLIKSKDITNSLKVLYELAWAAAVPYEKVIAE